MCGIVGFCLETSRTDARHLLRRMTDVIEHRGPDDFGGRESDRIGIGMRRLSIIDVDGGQQPISNEAGDIHVVCNGEIYNYRELREQLIQDGHQFSTHSDAEVIVHLYEDLGEECVHHLYGMFGFAIWDQRKDQLMVARDRLGQKPLYIAERAGEFWFASEMKSILAASPELGEENLSALGQFLQYGYIHQPETVYRDITQLPAAHYGVWKHGQFSVHRYWDVRFVEDDSLSYGDWQEQLHAALTDAVRLRLRSDVPLGVFLSGGIDSSLVVAYAKEAGLDPLKTFTIGFDRSEWDESDDALEVARHFGTDHQVLKLRESEMRDQLFPLLESITHHCDSPFGDASTLPTFLVSKMAREHVTAILSGDGGDELFAGYTAYRGALFAQRYRALAPLGIGANLLPGLARLASKPVSGTWRGRLQRIEKVLRDSSMPLLDSIRSKMSIFNVDEMKAIVHPDLHRQLGLAGDQYLPDDLWAILNEDRDLVGRLCEVDVKSYMLDDILVKVDRMSMAHSLEVRSPMMDHRLVELAAKLPTKWKVGGGKGKRILRDLLSKKLPPRTVRKPKQGFSVPLRDWFRGPLRESVRSYLLDDSQSFRGVFQEGAVEKLLNEHQRQDADHARKIWLLLCYVCWARRHATNRSHCQTTMELAV